MEKTYTYNHEISVFFAMPSGVIAGKTNVKWVGETNDLAENGWNIGQFMVKPEEMWRKSTSATWKKIMVDWSGQEAKGLMPNLQKSAHLLQASCQN